MRLSNNNIHQYINSNQQPFYLAEIESLLQRDYGEDNDCTLTSITTVLHWLYPSLNIVDIYNAVEYIAQKYGYTGTEGTNPLTIKKIYNKSLNYFSSSIQVTSKYLKGIGYTYNQIIGQINRKQPVLLNMWKDGLDYYKNHSVLIVGYLQTIDKKMLVVYDNWFKSISYIDYDKLSVISSIQVFKDII